MDATARIPLLLLLLLSPAAAAARAELSGASQAPEAVVLLHGLGRTERSMQPLADRLARSGFRVHNLRYPSTEEPPEKLVEGIAEQVDSCCADAPVLHFVGHSLGGILVRAYLARQRPPNLGRVVMLASPNRGSELVDVLGDTSLFRWILGPTAEQLGTDAESLPNRLPPPTYEVGVIAGTDSVNPIGSLVLPEEDDGTVSVDRTKVEGMTDFLVVPVSHTFIMRSEEVAEQVVHFFRHGRFRHPAAE